MLGTNLTGLEVLHALAQHQAAGKKVVVDGKEVSTGSSIRLQVILIGEQGQLPPQSFPDLQLRAVMARSVVRLEAGFCLGMNLGGGQICIPDGAI